MSSWFRSVSLHPFNLMTVDNSLSTLSPPVSPFTISSNSSFKFLFVDQHLGR